MADSVRLARPTRGPRSGWFDGEHKAYGIPFPPLKERFDRFEEQLAIITGLWAAPEGATFSYDGTYYQVTDSPALPKPSQRPGPPVIIGGGGKRRTPALAARYADEFNAAFQSAEGAAELFGRVREACEAIGRDPNAIDLSAAQVICCGKDEAELARRAEVIGRDLAELRENGLAGTPSELVDKIAGFAEAGATTLYLQMLDLNDIDHMELIASAVLPQV